MLTPGYTTDAEAVSTPLFHTLERRVRARGLQQGRALVGRVPSRGALLAFQSEREISRLKITIIGTTQASGS